MTVKYNDTWTHFFPFNFSTLIKVIQHNSIFITLSKTVEPLRFLKTFCVNLNMDLTDWESRTACSTMEAYVTCPVCKEVVHNPHILPCLHSMCYECALTLEKQTHLNKCGTFIVCPICREMDVDRVGFQRDHNMEVILGIYCSLLNFDQSKMSIKIPKPGKSK